MRSKREKRNRLGRLRVASGIAATTSTTGSEERKPEMDKVAVIYGAGGAIGGAAPRRKETVMRSFPGAWALGALTATLLMACAPAPETKTAAPEAVTPAK